MTPNLYGSGEDQALRMIDVMVESVEEFLAQKPDATGKEVLVMLMATRRKTHRLIEGVRRAQG